MTFKRAFWILILLGLGIFFVAAYRSANLKGRAPAVEGSPADESAASIPDIADQAAESPNTNVAFALPLDDALSRVTKKPFGIKITPQTSPITPERFSGYHTGADFETFASEQDTDVPVWAICPGPLVYKKSVNGYGGVAIQRCELAGQAVTVLYGHLRLSSIGGLDKTLAAGERIGILGNGYSAETDGERKHLHLAIHKGNAVALAGYVQNRESLADWIDPVSVLK